jgi:hypothetical protein
MSNFEEDFYEDDSDQQPSQNPVRAQLKAQEKELRELRKQLAESQTVQKELAFVKAGIDLTSPMSKYFIKGYDGELTPEAIRLAAEEAQLITPQVSEEDQAEKQGWKQTNKIAAGSEVSPPPASWIKRIQDAASKDEVFAIYEEASAQGIEL